MNSIVSRSPATRQSAVSWIPVIQHLLEICIVTQKNVGGKTYSSWPWTQLMLTRLVKHLPNQRTDQLPKHSMSKEKGKLHTRIVNILKQKPGDSPIIIPSIENWSGCTRAEIVCWVTENARPYNVVADWGFKNLMKTGRPEYYLPSPRTVSRDVRTVFARSRQRIAAMLRVCS